MTEIARQFTWTLSALDLDNTDTYNTVVRELAQNHTHYLDRVNSLRLNPNLRISMEDRASNPEALKQYNKALAELCIAQKHLELNTKIQHQIYQTRIEIVNLEQTLL